LDLGWRVIQVVLGIKVPVYDVVTKLGNVVETARNSCASSIRRTQILWEEAKNVAEGHLIVDDLLLTELIRCSREILMRPAVRGELMAF